MKSSLSLKHRIARAFILMAVMVAGFFCLVAFIAVEVIEEQVIESKMEKLGDSLVMRHRRNEKVELPPGISFYVDAAIPTALRALPAGQQEARLENRDIAVLVRHEGGHRYVLAQEIDEFERTEYVIYSAVGAGFFSSLILAIVLGQGMARRMLAPVSALADAVSAHTPPADLPSLHAADEVGVLARALSARTADLQDALSRERLFTGDVSHELRTPLTIMLGAAEILKAQLAGHPALQESAERLRRTAAETSERVVALLWLSRAPERLSAIPTELNALVHAEIERCQPLLEGKPVRWELEELAEAKIQARPELVGMVVGNLLRNACQHTDRGRILVRIARNHMLIEDSGSGINAEVQAQMFRRLPGDGFEPARGGGMGLALVKRVVDHLHWEIRFETPEQGGSRFVLVFDDVETQILRGPPREHPALALRT